MAQLAEEVGGTRTAPAPTGEGVGPARDRIGAIDACRGFALLGIFMVNIGLFSRPFGDLMQPGVVPGSSAGNVLAHYATGIFFAGKFYAQFSMLFGMGLVLQMTRIEASGGRFVPVYLRRLAFLIVLGAIHANFMWYGDILFTYGTTGLVLLLMRRCRPRTMFICAAVLITWACALTAGFSALMSLAATMQSAQGPAPSSATVPDPAATSDPAAAPADDSPPAGQPDGRAMDRPGVNQVQPRAGGGTNVGEQPTPPAAGEETRPGAFDRFVRARGSPQFTGDPSSRLWMELEREAYQNGDFWQATGFRFVTWTMLLVWEAMGFWWHVLAMFLLGAGLLKAGLFDPARIAWHRRFVLLGLVVGVPLAVVGTFAPELFRSTFLAGTVGGITQFLAGPLMGLMYIGLVTLAVHSGIARPIVLAITRTGRMALTNYLMQTVIATTIFYWFGLGLFDRVSELGCVGIVVVVYAAQVVLSAWWMARFRFGPMEWLWRSWTYLRPQRMIDTDRRTHGAR